jgi:hypothetical protein
MKKLKKTVQPQSYNKLIAGIGEILSKGRQRAYVVVNNILVETYWQIGWYIVEYEQQGRRKVEYGSKLFDKLSKDLKTRYGKGFNRSNLIYIRLLYLKYPKSQTLSNQLTWSHYVLLLGVSDDFARSFYERQCINEKWSVRELKRQINSMLFERLALSKDKKWVLKLSRQGHSVEKHEDIIKEPYLLEFLKIPENYKYSDRLFVSKYKLYLPDKNELREKVRQLLENK